MWIGNGTQVFEWCHFEWPRVTQWNIQWYEASCGLSAIAELLVTIERAWQNKLQNIITNARGLQPLMLIQQHHINNALHIVTLLPNNYGALNTGLRLSVHLSAAYTVLPLLFLGTGNFAVQLAYKHTKVSHTETRHLTVKSCSFIWYCHAA